MAKQVTAEGWRNAHDPERTWLDLEYNDAKILTKMSCRLCTKHKDSIKYSPNFNIAYIHGVTERQKMKGDNVKNI